MLKLKDKKTKKDWDSFLPFYLQWYWQTAKMHPYIKSKAFYHGPRIKWMNLSEENNEGTSSN